MSTIKDVARVAGVSTSTVSSFLNQSKYVSPQLERKILDAIDSLNYRGAHPIARSLRRKQTGHVGVVLDRLATEQTMRSLKAISDVLNDRGFTLMLRDAKGDAKVEAQYIHDLISQQVDGLILAPVGRASEAALRGLNPDLPVVLLGDTLLDWLYRRKSGIAVAYAIQEGSRQAVAHLLSYGHTRIGLIGNEVSGSAFARGYEQAMVAAGEKVDPELVRTAPSTYAGGLVSLRGLMALTTRPTAIFITEQDMLAGVLNGLFEMGMRCPDHISLMAFGNIDWADAVQPPLTSLQGDSEQLGRIAAQQLLDRLTSRSSAHHEEDAGADRAIYISTHLIKRESVALYKETVQR